MSGSSQTGEGRWGSRIIWSCVLLSLLLGLARAQFWDYRHDEGTTFDVSLHKMAVGEYIPDWPGDPLAMTELTARLEERSGYTLGDTLAGVSTEFRTIHPPAYYLFVHIWAHLFGSGRVVFRLPAILLTAFTVLGLALLARWLIPRRNAGAWAAALFALSPWVNNMTSLARPYQLSLILAVWSTVAVLALDPRHPGSRRRAWWWFFGSCSVLGLYTLYHYAFVVAWQLLLLALLIRRSEPETRRSNWKTLVGCTLGIGLGFAPWLPVLRTHMNASAHGHNYFEGTVVSSRVLDKALGTLTDFAVADSYEAPGGRYLLLAAAGLGLITLVVVVWSFCGRSRPRLDSRARLFWLSAPAMPVLLGLADALRGSHTLFITKICFGFIILLILLVVFSWSSVPIRAIRILGLSAWVLLIGSASAMGLTHHALMESDLDRATEVLAQDDSPTHLLVLCTDFRGFAIPLLLTLRDAGISKVAVTCARREDLAALLEQVEEEKYFQRVSLINSWMPQAVGSRMWNHGKVERLVRRLKREGWAVKRATRPQKAKDWVPPVASPEDPLTLWLFGPVGVRCISGPR